MEKTEEGGWGVCLATVDATVQARRQCPDSGKYLGLLIWKRCLIPQRDRWCDGWLEDARCSRALRVFFFTALLPFQPRLQSMAAMGAFTAQLTHTLRVFTQRGSLIQTSISLLRCSFSDFMADDQTFMIFFLSSVIPPLTDFRLLTVGSCLRAVIILKKRQGHLHWNLP